MPRHPHHRILLLFLAMATVAIPRLQAQTSPAPPATTPSPQSPAYEVATIKPPGPNDYAMPLRQYIQSAYGIPGNSKGLVIGPDWINTATYVIHGQPPDSIRAAMQSMPPEQRYAEDRLMMQNLLADRFHLKAHFETRVMPVYDLIVAKGGPKLTENPNRTRSMAAVGADKIRGTAVPIHRLTGMLEAVPDIDGRVVIDKTGLTGTYDFTLKWTPLNATPSPDTDSISLFTALQDQLGLKLVPAKEPSQVLIIDHIERPSEN